MLVSGEGDSSTETRAELGGNHSGQHEYVHSLT